MKTIGSIGEVFGRQGDFGVSPWRSAMSTSDSSPTLTLLRRPARQRRKGGKMRWCPGVLALPGTAGFLPPLPPFFGAAAAGGGRRRGGVPQKSYLGHRLVSSLRHPVTL